jgi:hypothetical protein
VPEFRSATQLVQLVLTWAHQSGRKTEPQLVSSSEWRMAQWWVLRMAQR